MTTQTENPPDIISYRLQKQPTTPRAPLLSSQLSSREMCKTSLRKRSLPEGRDPSPRKEPTSRSPCAPPWPATQTISAVAPRSVSFPRSLGSAQSAARWSGNGQSSPQVGEMQPCPTAAGTPFFLLSPRLHLSDTHLPTKNKAAHS